jgi:3'-phosphoadenosine 5'-phosphosulfate sulfotransferase (PAPS reductase)/FAD synthetase
LGEKVRHILALSGGKDSSALAIYMLNKNIDMEYVFTDTGDELPETYEYLEKLSSYLGKSITWIKSERNFDYYLDMFNGVLPDPTTRWCTRLLKLVPYEEFIGSDNVISYVGIRADEPHRSGYISTKPNIKPVFPFIEDNIRRDDVIRILDEAGLGLPDYYKWRSRSGCYFCFYQQKREWVGLYENHPELFRKSADYEKSVAVDGVKYTWNKGEELYDLIKPKRINQIKQNYQNRVKREKKKFKVNQKLAEAYSTKQEIDFKASLTIEL